MVSCGGLICYYVVLGWVGLDGSWFLGWLDIVSAVWCLWLFGVDVDTSLIVLVLRLDCL